MPNTNRVLIGLPDQKTTGAISCGPLGTKIPSGGATAVSAEWLKENGFISSGYCNADGVSLTLDISTSNIEDWSGAVVRKLLETFDGTITFTAIELTYESLAQAIGEEYVNKTPATKDHGEQLMAAFGAHLPDRRCWVFRMKDGDNRIVVFVPVGQATSIDAINFNKDNAIGLPITVSCYDDGSGNALYLLTDDGQVLTAPATDGGTGDGGSGEGGDDDPSAVSDDDISNLIP